MDMEIFFTQKYRIVTLMFWCTDHLGIIWEYLTRDMPYTTSLFAKTFQQPLKSLALN